jgi:hypothetical protein
MREGKRESVAGLPPLRDGIVCIPGFLQMREGELLETVLQAKLHCISFLPMYVY